MTINRHGFELRRFVGIVTRATLVLLVGIFGAGVASAASVNCNSTLTGTYDSVVVQAYATCNVGAATINGSITMGTGAALNMYGPATVKGSISSNGSYYVAIYNTSVTPTAGINKNAPVAGKSEVVASNNNNVLGNLNITNNTIVMICGAFIGGNVFVSGPQGIIANISFGGSGDDADCTGYGGGNVIGGSVSIQNNNAEIHASNNVVGRTMTVSGNQGSDYFQHVLNNSVAGTLACFNNAGLFSAFGNSASTSYGQCAGKGEPPP